jgi:hypothetical protein
VPAQRYIREIVALSQVATHGGLTARKFRNRAGLGGALSFLLETRMDPKHGHYTSFRNIAVRSAKQLLAQRVFVELVAQRRVHLQALLGEHAESGEPLVLDASYASRGAGATLRIPLRSVADGELREFEFADHRAVRSGPAVALPACYWVTGHQAMFARLLDSHGFAWQASNSTVSKPVRVQGLAGDAGGWPAVRHELRELPAGSLRVAVEGRRARLQALLLEPRSGSSVFRYGAFARLLPAGGDCFVVSEEI